MEQKIKKLDIKIIVIIAITIIAVIEGIVIFTSNNKQNKATVKQEDLTLKTATLASENMQENEVISYTELISNIQEVEKIEITESNNTAKVKYKKKDIEKIVVIPSIDALTEYIKENNNSIKIKIK